MDHDKVMDMLDRITKLNHDVSDMIGHRSSIRSSEVAFLRLAQSQLHDTHKCICSASNAVRMGDS